MQKSNQKLCVDISVSCFIHADDLIMFNLETNEVKPYSEIGDDVDKWLINDSKDVLDKSYEKEFHCLDIEKIID